MAKFTVFFQDKPVHSCQFESGVVHIGRDDSNDIVLDSLAVAPAHAAIVIREDNTVIKRLNDGFPLKVNNDERKECTLDNGDKITIGKHSILYSSNEGNSLNQQKPASTVPPTDSADQEFESLVNLSAAGLQIMEGEHIGRIIPLKNAMTRLGKGGSGLAIISKRNDGFFLSPLVSDHSMTINHEPVKEAAVKLNNDDLVVVDAIPMKFFIG